MRFLVGSGIGLGVASLQNVLILFAHPSFQTSRVNRALVKAVRDISGVTFHDLYEEYPDFFIDVRREQELLMRHEVVVFQHPFYWYSCPALLKEWQDVVLEHGFAYGEKGIALRGKSFLSAITTGGPSEAYSAGGYNNFSIRQLLVPFEQTANLCGMKFLEPHVVHGTHKLVDESDLAAVAEGYRRRIKGLLVPPGEGQT